MDAQTKPLSQPVTTAVDLGDELNVLSALTCEPPPYDYVCGFSLVAGTVGVELAQTKTGKTFFTLEMLASIALSDCGFDPLHIAPRLPPGGKEPRVLYVTGEDSADVLWNRLYRIGSLMTREQYALLASRMRVLSLAGHPQLDIERPEVISALCEAASECRVAAFDTLSRFHRRDENKNGEMACVINGFEQVAHRTGAAVILPHHTSKFTDAEESDGIGSGRGASVIESNTRWGLRLRRIADASGSTDRYLRVNEPGKNYGAGLPAFHLERVKGGVLTYCTDPDIAGAESTARARSRRSNRNPSNGIY